MWSSMILHGCGGGFEALRFRTEGFCGIVGSLRGWPPAFLGAAAIVSVRGGEGEGLGVRDRPVRLAEP